MEIKALDVILHRNFSCPRLTPPKHLKASCLLVEIIDFHEGIPKLAYCGEGQREVPRDALLDLLEHTCEFFAGDRCTPYHTECDLSEGTGAAALPPDCWQLAFMLPERSGTC